MAPNVRTSTGIGFSSRSMNSDKLSKVATISGGIVGDVNADSIEHTKSCSVHHRQLGPTTHKGFAKQIPSDVGLDVGQVLQALSDGEGKILIIQLTIDASTRANLL